MDAPLYYVILDSNIWQSERLLQSTLGTALLHALTKDGAMILLPEIVEREVNANLLLEAEAQVAKAEKALQYLRQTSQRKIDAVIPGRAIIERGVQERWGQLAGRIYRHEFTFDHAKAALDRILSKLPPCGKENEQFRDCCIWECAKDLASQAPVHLVSNDYAFHQGGKRDAGLAHALYEDAKNLKHRISLQPDLDGFLTSLGNAATRVDDKALQKLIVNATWPHAEAWAEKQPDLTRIESAKHCRITGYATPDDKVVAIGFAAAFDTSRRDAAGKSVFNGGLTIYGDCAYDPANNVIADIKIHSWKSYVPGGEDGHWSGKASSEIMYQYREGDFRVI